MAQEADTTRVLAVASGGGHWVQLRRLRPAWDGCQVIYVTTDPGYQEEVLDDEWSAPCTRREFFVVPAASRWQKLRLLRQLLAIAAVLVRVRPDAIVTTGAAPGFFALWLGKRMGARTIWVDSIANAEEMSLSGRKACSCADLWLTQWEHLAEEDSGGRVPLYLGSVV